MTCNTLVSTLSSLVPVNDCLGITLEGSFEKNTQPLYMWPFYAIYCFSQEFVGRGILQVGLQDFLHDTKGIKSLFVNAIFLFILLLPLGAEQAVNLFLVGLPMGLLYLKQKTIWGGVIIHFFLFCFGILKV